VPLPAFLLTRQDTLEGASPDVNVMESSPKSSGDSDVDGEVVYHPSSSHQLIDPRYDDLNNLCQSLTLSS
jgi:hypothetical protein